MRKPFLLGLAGLALLSGCATQKDLSVYTGSQVIPSEIADEAHRKASKIKYKADRWDHWQSPEETERLGTGDCDDRALYMEYLLTQQGYESLRPVFGILNKLGSTDYHVWIKAKIRVNGREEIYNYDPGWIIPRAESEENEFVHVEHFSIYHQMKLFFYRKRIERKGRSKKVL